MKSIKFAFLIGSFLLGSCSLAAHADVKMPTLFADHMVLQREMPVPIWGWADVGESVTVSLAGQQKTATPDATGKWMVKLSPLSVGEPLTLTVKGKNTLTVSDILVGEVWLASGQSNMDYALGWDAQINAAALASANDGQLRYFQTPHIGNLEPQNDVPAKWDVATNDSVKSWSAVAYYFARNLREKLGVPVGILRSSYGGTEAEPWTSREALDSDPMFKAVANQKIAAMKRFPEDAAAFPAILDAWIAQNGAQDKGNSGLEKGWNTPEFDDAAWQDVELPKYLNAMGQKSGGVFWYRKTFVLPADATKDFYLNLARIGGAVKVYFNGVEVPEQDPPAAFSRENHGFVVPKALIRAGAANTLAIRQVALTQNDYFYTKIEDFRLPVADPKSLGNNWKFAVEQSFPVLSDEALKALPKFPSAAIQNTPSALFNAMINPLIPYALRGAIWYQGESNTPRPLEYRKLLPLLISDWRARWGEGNFPFYIVQLANYGAVRPQPSESNWALLREAQAMTATNVSNSGLATAIDIGDSNNIHPKNKLDVGKRLALVALNRAYGQKMEDSGPVYDGMKIEGNAIRLSFSHATGLMSKDGAPKQFAIAGDDRKFVWADAKIDGESIIVSSPLVAKPSAVRYAWADSPEGVNLTNGAGLPALPFRTDLNDMTPVATAAGELSVTGLLLNGDFSSPAVPADKNYLAAQPDGWVLNIKSGGPALGVEYWKKERPPYFFWSDPNGSISQTAPDKIAKAGNVYTLSYSYGGQGKGGSYTLTTSILVDGKIAATDSKEVDLSKPGVDRTATLLYTAKPEDAGKSIGVSFSFAKIGGIAIQGALKNVSFSVQ